MSASVRDVLWLRSLLVELGLGMKDPIPIHCDNSAATALSDNNKNHQRTKHIDIAHHFIREKISSGIIKVVWVPTAKQQADILTKALGTNLFIACVHLLFDR